MSGNKDSEVSGFSVITVPAVSIDCVCCVSGKLEVFLYPGAAPKSCGLSVPGKLTFFLFSWSILFEPLFSRSENLSWVSDWIFVTLFESLSNLKLTSSNLFVNSLNWFSISFNFNKCLVKTSSFRLSAEKVVVTSED